MLAQQRIVMQVVASINNYNAESIQSRQCLFCISQLMHMAWHGMA